MGQGGRPTVLFVSAGNDNHGRVAERLFNSVAARMGLPWQASSRALAPADDVKVLEDAALLIAVMPEEQLSLLRERSPAWAEKVEHWRSTDVPEALGLLEQQVMTLIARLFGGGTRPASVAPEVGAKPVCPKCRQPLDGCTCAAKKNVAVVKVGRETKGRRGKGVTTVWDVPLDEAGVRDLAARLKDRCGTGGTVKDGRIEIQGDQRDRIAAELEKLGYKVKRVGG